MAHKPACPDIGPNIPTEMNDPLCLEHCPQVKEWQTKVVHHPRSGEPRKRL